jgi:integrase/recombinase XerD
MSKSNASRIRITGPLASYASGFAAELSRMGYAPSSRDHQLWLLAHLGRWMAVNGVEPAALTRQVVDEFVAVRRAAGYTTFRSARALEPLMSYLHGLGVVGPAADVELTPVEVLLEHYARYLTVERGLASSTIRLYVDAVRPFVAGRVVGGELDLSGLTAGEVAGFLVEFSCGRSSKSAKATATALRSLLRFLHVEGTLASSLVGAVPTVASWQLAPLPRGLEPGEVSRLLASCDRRTTPGRRDFAMMLLMVRLGLRAGEVAGLELDNIDWRAGEIVVHGKGGRDERLPLPDDVGQAVAGYLQRGRPATAQGRCVFVRLNAPHRGLIPTTVTQAVFAAGQRAGLGTVRAHRLRHTAATQMLAKGAPLAEIGQLLRHRRALTTAIYAKADRTALRALARPWPAGAA